MWLWDNWIHGKKLLGAEVHLFKGLSGGTLHSWSLRAYFKCKMRFYFINNTAECLESYSFLLFAYSSLETHGISVRLWVGNDSQHTKHGLPKALLGLGIASRIKLMWSQPSILCWPVEVLLRNLRVNKWFSSKLLFNHCCFKKVL